MAQNIGKRFENAWKSSTPDDILIYRPPDAAGSFGGGNNTLRFSAHSPCDYFMFNGKNLWTLELKTFDGTSVSFERSKEDKGIIHYYQIDSLKNFSNYQGVISGFLLDLRKSKNTYFLNINEWDDLMNGVGDKKSFNEKDLNTYCSPIIINKKLLRTNYKYDVVGFLNDTRLD